MNADNGRGSASVPPRTSTEKDTTYQAQRQYYWTMISMIAEYTRPRTHEEMKGRLAELRRKIKREHPEMFVDREDYQDEVRKRLTDLALSVGARLPVPVQDVDTADLSWTG